MNTYKIHFTGDRVDVHRGERRLVSLGVIGDRVSDLYVSRRMCQRALGIAAGTALRKRVVKLIRTCGPGVYEMAL